MLTRIPRRTLATLDRLLHRREEIYHAIEAEEGLLALWVDLTLILVLGSAVYGAVLGFWRAPIMSLYVAIKLPLLLLGTCWLVMLLNWVTSRLLGSQFSFVQTGVMSFFALTLASLIMLSLAPISLLFAATMPGHDSENGRVVTVHAGASQVSKS